MNETEKEELFSKWGSCDRETRVRLACEYLTVMDPGGGQLGWLRFLQVNLTSENFWDDMDHPCDCDPKSIVGGDSPTPSDH